MTNPLNLHHVEWYNFYGSFQDIFQGQKSYNMITDNECALLHPTEPTAADLNHATFRYDPTTHLVTVCKANKYNFPIGSQIFKFTLLSAIKFSFSHQAAISHIQYELIGDPIPYIRVKCDYYKVILKEDRYTGMQTNLVPWKKDEIKQDHSKTLLQSIPKFDDFIISPNNTSHQPIIKNCYNLYSPFQHTPHAQPVTEADIPVTMKLITHVFGDSDNRKNHLQQGLAYLKVIYEYPKQILPILSLVSKPRDTGKTTFNNWLAMIFGNNYTSISPDALTKNFNSNYATKNIITFEEAFIEKQSGIEKLKHLSTGQWIDVSQKFVSEYSIPFYGKFILYSNKILDFMRIDNDEIRFWIRRLPTISGPKDVQIEEKLFLEIPKFLRYLQQLPPVDFSRSRMVFTKDDIETSDLLLVKEESRSQLYKEISIHMEDYFDIHEYSRSFLATPTDIKDRWFSGNNQVSISYIRKVIKDEMGLIPHTFQRYNPFETKLHVESKPGTPFEFLNKNYKEPNRIDPSLSVSVNEFSNL